MIHFVIPMKPVGVNASYVRRSTRGGGKGLMKTREARLFAEAIAMAGRAARAGAETMDGPVSVTLAIFFADERPDIDGPLKPILDAMQAGGAGIYANDRQVRRLLVERDVDRKRPRIEVWVEPFRRRVLPILRIEEDPDDREVARMALENVRMLVASRRDQIDESVAGHLLRFCADAGVAGSPLRDATPTAAPAKRESLSLRAPDPDADLRRQLAASRRIRSSKVNYR